MSAAKLIIALALPCAACAARTADVYARDTGAVLATKNDAIRACYNGVLKSTPGAKGTVTIRFDVETDGGRITNVAIDSAGTTAPASVSECVTQSLVGLAVAPPDSKKGKGTWVYDFAASASAASTTPAVTAPSQQPIGGTGKS